MSGMRIYHDPRSAGYGAAGHPERPERVVASARRLREWHPGWIWLEPDPAPEGDLLRAHSRRHLERLEIPEDFDGDTPAYPGISRFAKCSAGAALAVAWEALAGHRAFSLMRPPGHHAGREQAMGFCYLNSIAVAALFLAEQGRRVAIWDVDAHHGNGTESIVSGVPGAFFVSVHQYPGYPGTGVSSAANLVNFPVQPFTSRQEHMAVLRRSWEQLMDWKPGVVLVSAGFDAYRGDPITQMTLEMEDFGLLGRWLREGGVPAGAVLEGGYSAELPELIDAFLTEWEG